MEIQLGRYQHYKGKEYEVIGLAIHSETLEEMVVYKALYESLDFGENALWVRPKAMFFENVMVEGKEIPRFKFLGDN
jgi:hypothetical protein